MLETWRGSGAPALISKPKTPTSAIGPSTWGRKQATAAIQVRRQVDDFVEVYLNDVMKHFGCEEIPLLQIWHGLLQSVVKFRQVS